MLLELTSDQEFLRDTTGRFLSDQVPVGEVRRLRDDPVGFNPDYWRRGADLGWVSLLVSEDRGGGSISGRGLVDLTLIAHEFGRHAAPGPLLPSNVVASALSEASDPDPAIIDGLLSGAATAAWCFDGRAAGHRVRTASVEATMDGAGVTLNGVQRPVEHAEQAGHLLVTARTADGWIQVLVPRDAAGLSCQPMKSVDLTRRLSVVTFDSVRVPLDAVLGDAASGADQLERQLQLALVILTAETVGTLDRAFEMTLEWSFDRYSFGRPLASYQELKHRFADMKSWLEAAHAVSDAAAAAVQARSPEAGELVSVAKAFVGHYGNELVQDCVQIHGGIGVTFDHDLHLFLRRATLNSSLLGTPADHRQLIADVVISSEGTTREGL